MPSFASSSSLVFYVNGEKIDTDDVDPEWSLLYYLRNKLQLCGTKVGCGEGGCGACTVMISQFDRKSHRTRHFSVNACLMPLCSVHGTAITTIEGIGNAKSLHPIQERLYKFHGSQCGFCTPGIAMSMYALLRNKTVPTLEDIETTFQGNLCRCTGYRPILQGMQTFATPRCCQGTSQNEHCPCKKEPDQHENGSDHANEHVNLVDQAQESCFRPYDPSQEPIFPPELQITDVYDRQFLRFESKTVKWYRPVTLEQLIALKHKHPAAKLLAGNTEIGIEVKFKNQHYPILISVNNVPELADVSWKREGIQFGASTSLSRVQEVLAEAVANEPEHKTRIFAAVVDMLKMFSGQQNRNVASLAGNVVTASPISDLNPLLLAASAEVWIMSNDESRTLKIDEKFFCGYRKTQLRENEIVVAVTIPFSEQDQYFYGFKQAQRRDDDIAIVNAGMNVRFAPNTGVVRDIRLAFGGMSERTVTSQRTVEKIIGMQWNDQVVSVGCSSLMAEHPLRDDAPGGMVQFRTTLMISFFFKFYLKVLSDLQQNTNPSASSIPSNYQSALVSCAKENFRPSQLYQVVPSGQRSEDPVGRPALHESGAFYATGEAVYVDDIPLLQGELHMALVLSSVAHAKILSIDDADALALDGVRLFLKASDFPSGGNKTGIMVKDEEYCASEKVTCCGQIIGAIIARSRPLAKKAAKLVKIHYKELKPILTIEEAIAAESFYRDATWLLAVGDVEQAFAIADHVTTGKQRIGGQEHFYLETQSGQVVPVTEHDELVVTVACQSLYTVQTYVASALGIPEHKVIVKAKRLGGAFGGKETRAPLFAVIAALAAKKLQRPVRYALERDEDMICTGGRHPFLVKYKIGFTKDGKIQALQCAAYNNGGHVMDVSAHVMEMFMKRMDNAFKIPNLDFTGYTCRTHLPTNTAFRGFGAPQAMLFTQTVLSDIAIYLDEDPAKVQERNLYGEGDRTFLGQLLTHCTLRRCWDECLTMGNYGQRKLSIDQFNKNNRWKKRGIAAAPLKFGVGFIFEQMNQGGALVHIYTDGTVLVSHGGVEIGQGLHTKLIQVASRVLQIPSCKVHVMDTSTDRIPNAGPTAASMSSDLFGGAVKDACETLIQRLQPTMFENPKAKWEEWVKAAYAQRINLSATGFYKTRKLDELGGGPFQYCSYGASCSEVEVDCLSGEHRVIRTDIVMDVGESLNPGVDLGQIEGAFMQGYGLYTLEELRYSPKGELLTRGPGTYKIPAFDDIPRQFNVAMLKGSPNVHAIYSSKAVGEPPLLLAASVFCAIKYAILSARSEAGQTGIFYLGSPATAEKIRLACLDEFTEKVEGKSIQDSGRVPWFITV